MQFNAIVEHDQDGFFAYIPSLKGCVSQGDTLEEALRNIKEALELFLEDMDEEERIKSLKKEYVIAPIEIDIPHVG